MSNNTPKIAVILLNWNGCNDTLACLESLKAVTYPSLEIIVVDNGSKDDSVFHIFKRFPEIKLIETGKNLGFAEGNNVGIRAALQNSPDFVFLLNNDTIVAPDVFEGFVTTFSQFPKVGILGAKILLFDQKEIIDHLGGNWDKKTGTFAFVGQRKKENAIENHPQEIDYVCGAGMMIKKEVIEKIGLLEPRYFLIWEESDFCFRAKKAGFVTMTCPKSKIWHKVSASFVGGKPHSTYFWWRNRLLWIERNCPLSEKWRLSFTVLLPEIFHLLKIKILKECQLFLFRPFSNPSKCQERKKKLLNNKAALCGVRDYFFRRFGNGPSWIYTRSS